MKKISVILMGIVIVLGLVLTLTPIVGSLFFADSDTTARMAQADATRDALASWFRAPVNSIADAKALQKIKQDEKVSYFSFSTSATNMRKFIREKQLQQLPLTEAVMQQRFTDQSIPWWQPQALQRETWFHGEDQGNEISLIYNAKTHRGVMIIKQKMSES